MYQARRSSSSSYGSGKSQDNNTPLPVDAFAKRKRGRPRGNPVPLNKEERRQRNAQYERERRVGMAEAMKDLAAAMGSSDFEHVPNVHLLAAVLHKLKCVELDPPEDLGELRRINAKLEQQIQEASTRLAAMDAASASSSSSPDLHVQKQIDFVTTQLPEVSPVLQYPQPAISNLQAANGLDYWTSPSTSTASCEYTSSYGTPYEAATSSSELQPYEQPVISNLRAGYGHDYWTSPSTSTSSYEYTSYGTSYEAVTSSPQLQPHELSPVALDVNVSLTAPANASPPLPPVTTTNLPTLPNDDLTSELESALVLPDNIFGFDPVPALMDDEEMMELFTNLTS